MWMTARRRIPTALLLGISGVAGCGGEIDPDTPAFAVRDSAGVSIYENFAPEWTEATAWKLSSEPTLAIGLFDGPEEYLLFGARGARRLSNGNILIANGGTHELRFYDPNGTHLRSVGREGAGPGEFGSMGVPWPLGSDSIAIWDTRNARLTVFDIDGRLDRSFRLDPIPDARSARPQGILADNTLLVYFTIRPEGERPQGLFRDSIVYARYSLDGALLATSVRPQGTEMNATSPAKNMFVIMGVPFGRSPTTTASGDRWYYGSGDSWEIEVYSPDGALTHLFRRDEPNRPVTKEMEDAYREAVWDSGDDIPTQISDMMASMAFPEIMPAYSNFIVSDDGSFWVQNYTQTFRRSGEQPSWAVFRADGRYLGDVDTPIGARLTHIGNDFVLAIWEDELEVQQVRMYELIKP